MPRKKPQIGRLTPGARRKRHLRSLEDHDEKQKRLMLFRVRQKMKKLRESQINNGVNEQSSGNFVPVDVVEVTLSQIKSDVEDSDGDDNSKQTDGDKECKLITLSELGVMKSEETCISDGCVERVKKERKE